MAQATGPQVALGTDDVDSQEITQEAILSPEAGLVPPAETSGNRFLPPDEAQQPITDTVAAPPHGPEWQSEQTQRSRQIGLVVALAACGLIASLLLFGWFVRSWSNKTADVTPGDEIHTPVDTAPDEIESTVDPLEATTTDDPSVEPEQPAEQADTPRDESSNPPPVIDTSVIPADLVPQSPLLTPSESGVEMPKESASVEPQVDPSMGLNELPAGLAEFTNLIDMANDGGIRKPTLEAPPSMDAPEIEGPAEELIDPMMIAAPPAAINMKRGLSIPMAFALTREEGYPLADLVMLVSQVTGIPIQLDWISFDLANIDVRKPIKTSKGWKDAAAALDEIAKAIGADIDQGESLISISPSDVTFDEPMKSILDLSDFGNQASSATDVINEFLGAKTPEDPGVSVGPERTDQQLAAIAVETLRQMRGLPTKLPDHRLSRWTQAAEQQPESWNLLEGGKSSPQYDAPATVAEVLRRVARSNHASCIVNWHDARRRRLSPEQITLPFAGTDGGTELAEMLKPFGMQVRKVDANHWWVGTAATYDRLPLVIWTVPLGDRRKAFTRQIQTVMAGADEDSFRMAIDPVSDRAILLLPRFIVRQLPAIQAKIAAK